MVFIPITIEPYKNNPSDHVNNRWKLILPAGYASPDTPITKYLFITPDYKTMGDDASGNNAKKFGDPYNVDYVYSGNIQYEFYSIGSSF